MYVRGYNNTLSFDSSHYEYFSFSTDAYVYVSGIVESLIDGDNEVLALGAQGILRQLFYKQTALRSAENLRFEAQSTAVNIVSVYALMFDGCTSLKTIRCMAKVKAPGATEKWVNATALSGTFYGHSEYGWSSGSSGIPSGWEFVELTD